MKTSRILLRLLLLLGSVTLLLDPHRRGFATYSSQCGEYNTPYENCPSPCTMNYFGVTYVQPGPYYQSGY